MRFSSADSGQYGPMDRIVAGSADLQGKSSYPITNGAPKPTPSLDPTYRCLFLNNLDAVFALDEHGRFTEANPAAEKFSGYSSAELRSKTYLDLCAPDDRAKAEAFFARAMAGAPRNVEVRGAFKGGGQANLMISGAPILQAGRIVGIYFIAHDVTRRTRIEARLRRARREADQEKDRFLADLSHELRTPLMPVLTAVQMLQNHAKLPQDMREMLSMMRRNLELEARLIDDLLDLNRLRQGRLTLYRQSTDVHARIHDVADLCQSDLMDKRQRVKLDLAATDFRIAADPARVQQVLWNLIGNAIKFTPAQGEVTIQTRNGPMGGDSGSGSLVVEVVDTGIGMDAEDLARAFKGFARGGATGGNRAGRGSD